MTKNRKILLAVTSLALLAAATVLPITLASAAPQKIYDLTMDPTSLASGQAGQTITATFKNATPSGNSTINSLKLFADAPTGFVITGASGTGTVAIQPDGQSVWVSNISGVRPGKFYTLVLTVTTPAATGCEQTIEWSADVRAGNSFTGDTFAPHDLVGVSTSLAAGCDLSFTKQPADALKGETIGAVGGGSVQVTGSPAALFNGSTVTLSIADDSPDTLDSPGSLTGNTGVVSGGVATFPLLKITESGTYRLVASALGTESASSDEFTISDGTLGCSSTNNTATAGAATVVRGPDAGDTECVLIPYILTFDGHVLSFLKDPSIDPDAQFTIHVDAWADEPAVLPLPVTQVDTPSPDHDIQWCLSDAFDPSALPAGEVTCLVDQSAAVQANGSVTVSETYYLFGDILYKR
jgi:hypothetical protein